MTKILIVSTKAGAGHVKAAEALEVAAKRAKHTVKNIDLLEYTHFPIKRIYGKGYLDVVKTIPVIYAHGYKNYKFAQWFTKPRLFWDRIYFAKLFKTLKAFNPDVILATHFIPSAVLANFKKKTNATFKLETILTDYEFHPLWLTDGVDHYFVATEDMKHDLQSFGVPAKKVTASGIPVLPSFSDQKPSKAALKIPTILISAGSFGVTSLAQVVKKMRSIEENFHAIIVCGHNKKLQLRLKMITKHDKRFKKIYEYVDFMDKLMKSSDLFVTKPGGMSVSEGLVSHTPMLLIDPIPGQEEANARYAVAQKAAVHVKNTEDLIKQFKKLLKTSSRLAKMANNAQAIAKPKAASEIIKHAMIMAP